MGQHACMPCLQQCYHIGRTGISDWTGLLLAFDPHQSLVGYQDRVPQYTDDGTEGQAGQGSFVLLSSLYLV